MIADKLFDRLAQKAKGNVIADLRVGLCYTAVRLDHGGCGLAYTYGDEAKHSSSVMQEAGTFVGRDAYEIAKLVMSLDILESALGLATLNALVDPSSYVSQRGDVRDLIEINREDTVGMIGRFRPMVKALKNRSKELYIFERKPYDLPDVYPDWAIYPILPRCDIVILTATAILNKTLDPMLKWIDRAREVVLLGPTTPLVPEAFEGTGITLLSGVEIVDPEELLRVVSEGGGTRQFRKMVRKVSVRVS